MYSFPTTSSDNITGISSASSKFYKEADVSWIKNV